LKSATRTVEEGMVNVEASLSQQVLLARRWVAWLGWVEFVLHCDMALEFSLCTFALEDQGHGT